MHAPTRRLGGLLAITVSITLLAAACSGSQAGAGSESGGVAGETSSSIGFASPSEGVTVDVPFDVELEASVPLGDPETGNHHAHLYFDTDTNSADYDIVYGTSWQVTRDLAPGSHTVTVALANPDHSLAGPTQSITIEVGSGAGGDGGDGGSPAASPTEGIPGY